MANCKIYYQAKLKKVGLSPAAEKLAIFLNERSEYGREYDPNLTADEILNELDLNEDEIAIAADELENLGWVHLSKTIDTSRISFHYITSPIQEFLHFKVIVGV